MAEFPGIGGGGGGSGGSISKFFVTIGSKFDDKGFKSLKSNIKVAVVAIGAFGIALGTTAVVAAAKFQSQMAMVSTMLDDVSRKLLPKFETEIRKLSIQYGETTKALSKGLFDILSAGIASSEALDVLEASALAAKAGLTDTGIAADAITTVLNSYSLEAKDAADISDFFFAVIKRGKTTFSELAPVIGRVTALAASSGLSLNELGASLATMTKSGIKTEEAVTSLRGVMTAFLKPTRQAKDAAKELGVEISTGALRANGLIKTLEKLSGATDEQVAAIFGNVRALAGLSTILKDTSVFYADLDFITNRAGKSQEAFEIITNTLTFEFQQAKQAVTNLFSVYGKELLPVVRKVSSEFIILTSRLAGMTDGIKKSAKAVVDQVKNTATALRAAINPASAFFGFIERKFLSSKKKAEDLKNATDDLTDTIVEDNEIITESDAANKEARLKAEQADAEARAELKEKEEEEAEIRANNKVTRENMIAEVMINNALQVAEDSEKAEDDLQKKREARAKQFGIVVSDALSTIQRMETITWNNIADAYKNSVIRMIGFTIQRFTADFVAAKALAIINGVTSFGFAAGQIAAVLAVGTAASAGLSALQNFDEAGVVQGPPGKPVLVQALGGEKFLGRQSIGKPAGGVTVVLRNPFFLGSRQDANRLVEIVSDGIFKKVNRQIKI